MAAAGIETTETAGADNPLDRAREALGRLTNRQKVLLIVSLATVVTLLIAAATLLRQGEFKVLFSNIGERDGGAIIAALEQMNVPYKFSESGSAILVHDSRVHDVRLRLAAQGLPRGGAVGFELMEAQKFGVSQFAEQVNYQRGLEGELSRTIQSIAAVQAARVHLAIPKPSVFMREELNPSASVFLNLYPGRSLEPRQIAGIQNLVAASVPQLAPTSVTLLDQSGALLSQMKSKLLEDGLDPTQVKYIQEVEARVIKRVEDILAPIVGPGNARVQIAADIDFSQSEAHMVEGANDLQPAWFEGRRRVGLTAGASAPDVLLQAVITRLRELGALSIRKMDGVTEDVHFPLPRGLGDRSMSEVVRPDPEAAASWAPPTKTAPATGPFPCQTRTPSGTPCST